MAHESHLLFPQVQGKQPPETQTGNQEAEESQALVKFGAFTHKHQQVLQHWK